jgi:hypothetical protein
MTDRSTRSIDTIDRRDRSTDLGAHARTPARCDAMSTTTTTTGVAAQRDEDARALRAAMDGLGVRAAAAGAGAGARRDDDDDVTAGARTMEPPVATMPGMDDGDGDGESDEGVKVERAAVSVSAATVAREGPPAATTDALGRVVVSELPNNNGTTRPACTVSDAQVALLEAYLRTGFGLVHDDGVDGSGAPVVTVNATRIPGWAGSADRDKAQKLIVKVLEATAARADEYSVVIYFGSNDRTKGVVPSKSLQWLSDVHEGLSHAVRKNVQRIVFVNCSWVTSTLISMSMSFVSSKAYKKMVWTNSLDDMDKDSGFHINAEMCGKYFLDSVGWTPPSASATSGDDNIQVDAHAQPEIEQTSDAQVASA